MHAKIEGESGYVKDTKSRAILAKGGNPALVAYKKRKEELKKKAELEAKVASLTEEVSDMKKLLLEIKESLINKNS